MAKSSILPNVARIGGRGLENVAAARKTQWVCLSSARLPLRWPPHSSLKLTDPPHCRERGTGQRDLARLDHSGKLNLTLSSAYYLSRQEAERALRCLEEAAAVCSPQESRNCEGSAMESERGAP